MFRIPETLLQIRRSQLFVCYEVFVCLLPRFLFVLARFVLFARVTSFLLAGIIRLNITPASAP